MEKIDSNKIEDHFEFYLKKLYDDPNKMPTRQYQEIKRSFYGGFTQSIIMILEMAEREAPEDEAIEFMSGVLKQSLEFFSNESSVAELLKNFLYED